MDAERGTSEPVPDELTLLRGRVVELEQMLEAAKQLEKEREHQALLLREQTELLDLATDAIIVRSLDGEIRFWNHGAERMYKYSKAEALGRLTHDILQTVFPEPLPEIAANLMKTGFWEGEVQHTRQDGAELVVHSRWVLRQGADGAPTSVMELNTDITERKRAEIEKVRLQEEIIRTQAATVAALSTPLIPISDKVLVMPLIGAVDTMRAQQVLQTLLQGMVDARGEVAILDITGVPVVDTQVANALLQAARAVRLLGAEVVLTGIRPEVAQTLVALQTDMSGITTRGNLQSGIAFALERLAASARFGGGAPRGGHRPSG